MTHTMDINLTSPAFKVNPYPTLSWLRSDAPVHQIRMIDGRQVWLISRYEDVELVLRDQRFAKDVRHVLPPEQLAQQFIGLPAGRTFLNQHMLNADPPDHTRLRSLVSLSFTPRLVEQWHGRIQEITDELLDTVQEHGTMELIDDFAFPLPIMVITEMLGVPTADQMKFRRWSNLVVEASGNPAAFAALHDDMEAFGNYLHALIAQKRAEPSDDLLSKLIRAEAEGDKLTENELISMVFLLLIAGHETTVNLITNGMLALLQHPDQLEKLKQNPALIKTAVEEFLRYQGPLLTATMRWAREDVELGGKLIRHGEEVIVLLASANRDEQEFSHAADLDITREDNHHLAFGKGIHYCLGAPLARLEGQVAISTLLRRMPNLRLTIDPQDLTWRPGMLLMGLSKLPVAF